MAAAPRDIRGGSGSSPGCGVQKENFVKEMLLKKTRKGEKRLNNAFLRQCTGQENMSRTGVSPVLRFSNKEEPNARVHAHLKCGSSPLTVRFDSKLCKVQHNALF